MATENSSKPAKALADTAVKNLKPKTISYEKADASSSGLRLRVSPKGKKTWFYRYREPTTNKLIKLTLGAYPGMSLAQARREWSDLKDQRDAGTDPKTARAAEQAARAEDIARKAQESQQSGQTVKALVNAYLDHASQHKASWREDKRILEKELLPKHCGTSIHELSRGDVRDVLDKIKSRGAQIQANRALSAIRKAFNWAIENDWPSEDAALEKNPCWGLKATKEEPRQRALNDTELGKVLKKLPDVEIPSDHRDMLLFILLTGCRIGEAETMEWAEILGDEWRIPSEKTKNRRTHTIYLSPQSQVILKDRDRGASWVWPSSGTESGHVRSDAVQTSLNKAVPHLKVEKFTPHDLRRTLATWLGDQQVDEAIHDRMLNHVSGGIRKVYNTAKYNKPAKEWWRRWGRHIASLQAENVVQMQKGGAA